MKKQSIKFSVLAMIAMMTMCMFIACGGDDNDDAPDNGSSIAYIEPCFKWGASLEEVKAWMEGKPFVLQMDQYMLYYIKTDGTAAINYMFDGNIDGLYFSMVTYEAKDSGVLSSLISQTEKRYNTTLRKVQEGQYTAYMGNAVVGGRMVGIVITPRNDAVEVLFAIPE